MANPEIKIRLTAEDLAGPKIGDLANKMIRELGAANYKLAENYRNLAASGKASIEELKKAYDNMMRGIAENERLIKQSTNRIAKETETSSLTAKLKSNWLAAAGVIAGAMIAINKAWNLADIAAQFEEQKTALNSLASQYNTTADAIISDVKNASKGLISMADAASVSAKALMMGMKPDQIVQFMKVVEATTNVTGQTVSSAFETITEAAGAGREKSLKQMGIIVDLQGAYKDYAESIKKTVDELSESEKQTAAVNTILGKSSEILKQLGDAGDSTNDKMERFKAMMADFRLILGDWFIKGFAAASMTLFTFSGAFYSAAGGIVLGIQKIFELGAKIPLLGNIFDPVAKGAKEAADFLFGAADKAFDYGLISYEVISGNEQVGKSFQNLGVDIQDSTGKTQLTKKEMEGLVQYLDKIKEIGKVNLEFSAEGLKEVFDNLKQGGDSVDELKKQMQDASGAVDKYGRVVDEVYSAQKKAVQDVIKQLAEQVGAQESIEKAVKKYSQIEVSRLKTNMSAYETYYDFLKGKMDEAIKKQKTLNDEIDAAKKTLAASAQSAVLEIKAPEMTDTQKLSAQMTDALGLQGKERLTALNQYINDVKKSSLSAAQKVSMIYDAETIGAGVIANTTAEWQNQETAIKNIKTTLDDVKKTIDDYKTQIASLSAEIEKMENPVALNLDTTAADTALKSFLDSIPNSKTITIDIVYTSSSAAGANTDIKSYAQGTPYVHATGLALLHQGERVLTAEENKAYTYNNQKSFSPNITINSTGGNVNARAFAKQVGKEIQRLQYLM